MASGTKIRRFTRLLDDGDAPLWVIGSDGRLVYLSAACTDWLGVDGELLIDRRAIAGAPVSDEPLDRVAASLSPPQGFTRRGTASLKVQPPAAGDDRPVPLEVRYVRVGEGENHLTIGVGGRFDDRTVDPELQDAVALRQRLDGWRKRHAALANIATAGTSPAARRLRRRIRVAASTRTNVGLFGPTGCGSEAIAKRIHQLSAPGESIVTVDGPLMDAELIDATMMPVLHQLGESPQALASFLVRGLDEMAPEAQYRLVSLVETFDDRLRLLALCRRRPPLLSEEKSAPDAADLLSLDEQPGGGICPELVEVLSSLTIVCQRLTDRVEDIPLIATAMLDMRHAAGEGTAERISRAALDALVIYPWPRDLDELDEAVRHAVRTAPGESVAVEHLPLAVRSYRSGDPAATSQSVIPLDVAMQRYQRRLIHEALEACGGNRAEASRRLGISRARLLRKLEEQIQDDSATDESV